MKRFNGKPMSHWQKEADKLVIDLLYRASLVDRRSIIGELAHKRLIEIAKAESGDSGLFEEAIESRDCCRRGMAAAINSMITP